MSPQRVATKFHGLAAPFFASDIRAAIVEAVARLDRLPLHELTALLGRRSAGEPR